MNKRYLAMILAGGKGERFWPLSTELRPKQLLDLVGGKPLIAQAIDRLNGLIPPEQTWIVTNRDLMEPTRQILPDFPSDHIIGEPMGRDTAAAIALGGAIAGHARSDAVFCVLTADHVIGDLDRFQAALAAALDCAAREDVLVTMGIRPTRPDTGYGYIECGEPHGRSRSAVIHKVRRFVEKPDARTAQGYLAAGNFYWNSGMFIWSVDSLRRALREHCPELADLMADLQASVGRPDFQKILEHRYETLRKISIDYALMEKARNILMTVGDFAWDDVGSWTALKTYFQSDSQGNSSSGRVEQLEARNNLVYSRDRLTVLLGVEDLIVVNAPGATLVCHKDKAQDIKKMVDRLRKRGDCGEVL